MYRVLAAGILVLPLISVALAQQPAGPQTPQQQSIPTQPATGGTSQREIPDDNLGYPALIIADNLIGSGFYLNTDKGVFLVTAKHVLFNPVAGKLWSNIIQVRSYSPVPADLNPIIFALDVSLLRVKAHPSRDLAVVQVATSTGNLTAGTQTDGTWLPGVQALATNGKGLVTVSAQDTVSRFDQILVGNSVILFGYPTSLELKEIDQLDPLRPLLRRGLVAGLNTQKRSVVLDCPVYPGNSGGPVVEMDRQGWFGYRFSVIGVVSEFVPFRDKARSFTMDSNSGYSIATPMDFVLDLINNYSSAEN
jgi:hypothetical protein